MSNRVFYLIVLCLCVTSSADADEGVGQIKGSVRFFGDVPPAKKIMTTDGGVVYEKRIDIDTKTKGLRSVVVTLENAPAQPAVKGGDPAYVDQREMLFVPRVVAVQQGQAVRFDNSDSCNHSVMAISTVKANQFNLFVAQGKPYDHVFDLQKRPIIIGCSIHPWMRAWVYVVAHPWFAVTDKNGTFTLADVPAGKYKLLVRHPDTGHEERKEIVVRAGQTTKAEFTWKKLGK